MPWPGESRRRGPRVGPVRRRRWVVLGANPILSDRYDRCHTLRAHLPSPDVYRPARPGRPHTPVGSSPPKGSAPTPRPEAPRSTRLIAAEVPGDPAAAHRVLGDGAERVPELGALAERRRTVQRVDGEPVPMPLSLGRARGRVSRLLACGEPLD